MFNLKILVPMTLILVQGCNSLQENPFSVTVEHTDWKVYREHCEYYKDYYLCMEKVLNKATPRIRVDDLPENLAELLDIHQDFTEQLLDYIYDLKSACQNLIGSEF